jgi:hypothetical protein
MTGFALLAATLDNEIGPVGRSFTTCALEKPSSMKAGGREARP